jgi:hypothetical protein
MCGDVSTEFVSSFRTPDVQPRLYGGTTFAFVENSA